MSTRTTVECGESRSESDMVTLRRHMQATGLLQRRRGYYSTKIVLNVLVFAAGWVAFAFIGDSWWQLAMAVFFAVMFTQLAFIGHDAGHKQIFRTRRANDAVGYAHGGLTGLSYGWWVGKHNQHHVNPNHEDDDPDLDIPALAFTTEQARNKTGFLRWIAKYQAFMFFPLVMVEGLNLHWASSYAVARDEIKARKLESILLAAHFVIYLTAVFLVLSLPVAVAFIAVHQGLWGVYMSFSFAPNHKGMPTLRAGTKLDFLRKQVLTTRNVRGNPWVDFAVGGLNYQIEHHLFPNMPRPNLRLARPHVRAFCTERGLAYTECGLWRSYAYVLAHLHAVGAELRTPAVK